MEERATFELFPHLDSDLRAKLNAIMRMRTFAAGERIFLQGAPPTAIYLVTRGRVKITRVTREGFETVLCLCRPGNYFCPVSLLDGGGQLGTAIALTQVTLLWADREEFNALCEESPELLSMVQGACLAEVRHLLKRAETFAFRNVRERLAMALLDESQRQALEGIPHHEVHLTQQELAGLVGSSRESVSRALGRLAREGFVQARRGCVLILNHEGLRQLIDSPEG